MKNKYSIILFLCVTLLLTAHQVLAQKETEKKITIESVIEDEAGNPIAGAKVFCGNGYAKTDSEGKFTIAVEPDADLVVQVAGYEDVRVSVNSARNESKITLKAAAIFFEEDQKVALPFNRRSYRGDVVGAVSSVNIPEATRNDYNRVGLSSLRGKVVGLIGSSNIRGIGAGLTDAAASFGIVSGLSETYILVDGLPRSPEFLRSTEIESITVLKDANAAVLYGAAALDGVLLVTTKRGEAYKKRTDVNLNYGLDFSKENSFPKFLNSADYMTYYNIARRNDGMTDQWTEAQINNYRNGNKYRYPDVDYYSSDYIKSYKDWFDINTEFSGGNRNGTYYVNAGWYSEGTLLNFGSGKDERINNFNIRANVDMKINDWINTAIDGNFIFNSDKFALASYWGSAINTRPYEYAPLLPISLIDPNDPELLARKRDIDGLYLVGGSNSYQSTPFGSTYLSGTADQVYRNLSFNNRINFDFGQWVSGLSFHTNINFDFTTQYYEVNQNSYSTYEPTWAPNEDKITALKKYGNDASSGNLNVPGDFRALRRMVGFSATLNYDRTFDQVHRVTGALIGYATMYQLTGNLQGNKQAHLGMQLGYNYDHRYMIDFSAAAINSTKLAPGHRLGFSPTLGLAWVLSSEDFMSSAANIDYLKVRASAGNIKSDIPIGGYFYYDERITTNGTVYWNNSRSRAGVITSWTGNTDLTFVSRNDFNAGFEGLFFNKFLEVEANYFYSLYDNIVARSNSKYPNFYATTNNYLPYENLNANLYQGIEAGLTFRKNINDWAFTLRTNMVYTATKLKEVDEIYANDYQYRKGRPVGNYFGLEAIGFFQNEAEINDPKTPYQLFSALKPGDIRYKDQNGDNVINSNDQVYLGRSTAPFYGAAQLSVSYKNWTLFASGYGISGGHSVTESNYYWIDGTKKYSEVVLNSWTPETSATATYPRLSSSTNSNNNQRSNFWMYSNDYFNLDKVQLTYSFSESLSKAIFMKGMDVFATVSNIYMFSKNRDKLELRFGGEPAYRTFLVGVKAMF